MIGARRLIMGGASAVGLGSPPAILRGALHLYRLYDVGYAIALELARATLTTPATRARPVVSRGGSITIPELPLEIDLGECELALGGTRLRGRLHARVYDMGIVAF